MAEGANSEIVLANKMIFVTRHEAEWIKEDTLQNREIYFAEIDGAEIKTEEDYVRAMADAFAFPHELPAMKLGWFNDYINDLEWIEQKEIVLIIDNYDLMLIHNLKLKNDIMADFEEVILPWWEGGIVGHMVGGEPKKFSVYLEVS